MTLDIHSAAGKSLLVQTPPKDAHQGRIASPIDMALNHGTYCSERCVDVLRRHDSNRALRLYPAADNGDLKQAIAKDAGVESSNVLIANGSGPLLKMCIPYLIETKIKSSPLRMLRYLLKRVAYPIITTRLTYSKVPAAGVRQGLRCILLPLGPENGFALDVGLLEAQLAQHDGVVYLANPNNPTGNILVTRSQLEPLLTRFPDSIFFIDEAYLQYVPESPETRLSDLVLRHPNLFLLRSFSFAHGLASIRVGYVLANAEWIAQFEAKLTPHRVGQLAAELVMASLEDPRHLDFVREKTAKERVRLTTSMRRHSSIDVYPSETNFILCQVKKPWTGQKIHDGLLALGIKVKCFERFGDERYDEYFRVTIGLPEENTHFLAQLDELMRTGAETGVGSIN